MTDRLTMPQFTAEDQRLFKHGLNLCIKQYEAEKSGVMKCVEQRLKEIKSNEPRTTTFATDNSNKILIDYYDNQIAKCRQLINKLTD